uniref:Uncharacterized protein n=1 Tax=viral metagenome TaxID=1070528 RepID=A0A6M3JM38_9ZZZZ
MKVKNNPNPLFWRLSPADRAKLMMYQWNEYGYNLEIPAELPAQLVPNSVLLQETPEEYVREMRQPPHSPHKPRRSE